MHKVGLPDPFRSPLNASSLKISFVAMSHNLRCNTNHSSSLALASYTRGIWRGIRFRASARIHSAGTEEAFRGYGRSLPLLRKKLSESRKKPSALRRRRAANAFRKDFPKFGINFKDAYRTSLAHSPHTNQMVWLHVRGWQGLIVHDQSVCEVYTGLRSLGTRLPTQKGRGVWESCIQKAVTGYSIMMI